MGNAKFSSVGNQFKTLHHYTDHHEGYDLYNIKTGLLHQCRNETQLSTHGSDQHTDQLNGQSVMLIIFMTLYAKIAFITN